MYHRDRIKYMIHEHEYTHAYTHNHLSIWIIFSSFGGISPTDLMLRYFPNLLSCSPAHTNTNNNKVHLQSRSVWSILMLFLCQNLFGMTTQFIVDYARRSANASSGLGSAEILKNRSQLLPLSPDELEYTRLEQVDAKTRLYGEYVLENSLHLPVSSTNTRTCAYAYTYIFPIFSFTGSTIDKRIKSECDNS